MVLGGTNISKLTDSVARPETLTKSQLIGHNSIKYQRHRRPYACFRVNCKQLIILPDQYMCWRTHIVPWIKICIKRQYFTVIVCVFIEYSSISQMLLTKITWGLTMLQFIPHKNSWMDNVSCQVKSSWYLTQTSHDQRGFSEFNAAWIILRIIVSISRSVKKTAHLEQRIHIHETYCN